MSAKTRIFKPGDFIFREGAPSESMYVIQKGSVAIRKVKGNAYIDLCRIYHNEVVGELAFFDRQPRSAAAIALTEVEALEIRFESLDEIYSKIPPYFKTIMSCVADRLRKANETVRRLQKHLVEATEGVNDPSGKKGEDLESTEILSSVVQDEAVQAQLKKLEKA